MAKTGIPWATHVWNPFKGCSPISEGCINCYARGLAEGRLKTMGLSKYQDGFQVRLFPEKLKEPLGWKTPARIFIGSMGDIFHVEIPDTFIMEILQTVKECPWHRFMILTKRTRRMYHFMRMVEKEVGVIEGLYIGATIENNLRFNCRWDDLIDAPAAGRFISFEPLLTPIPVFNRIPHRTLQRTIDLAIIGCESGPDRRPTPHQWATEMMYGFRLLGIPVYLKQLSAERNGSGPIVKMPKVVGGIVHDQIPEGLKIGSA